jgi:pimeloyl-ACP methyl ester carboxylesterase
MLSTTAKFHRYSFRNQLLTFSQHPDATLVAGRSSCGSRIAQFKSAGGRASQPTAGEFLYDPIRDQLDLPLSTLLVYGDKDVRAPLTVAKDLEAAISDSTLVVLPDSGHVCNIEAPEEFNKAVRNFLAMRAADH